MGELAGWERPNWYAYGDEKNTDTLSNPIGSMPAPTSARRKRSCRLLISPATRYFGYQVPGVATAAFAQPVDVCRSNCLCPMAERRCGHWPDVTITRTGLTSSWWSHLAPARDATGRGYAVTPRV